MLIYIISQMINFGLAAQYNTVQGANCHIKILQVTYTLALATLLYSFGVGDNYIKHLIPQ